MVLISLAFQVFNFLLKMPSEQKKCSKETVRKRSVFSDIFLVYKYVSLTSAYYNYCNQSVFVWTVDSSARGHRPAEPADGITAVSFRWRGDRALRRQNKKKKKKKDLACACVSA